MRSVLFVALTLVVTLSVPAPALACACCSDPGERYESRSALSAYEKELVGAIRFSKSAHLYSNASDESVKGIDDSTESYSLERAKNPGKWLFSLRDAHGKTGTLRFSVPKIVDRFSTDLQDGAESSGGGPLLYKEWRLSGAVTATGIFAAGLAKGATAKLVLQARGNSCDEAEQFKHWMLIVSGPGAKYTFFGALL